MLLEQMKLIEQQVADSESKIKALMNKLNMPICTILGLAPILGAVILGEIGDIRLFDAHAK